MSGPDVQAHVLDLLARHVAADRAGAAHLDLGGSGDLAGPVSERLGLEYAVVDLAELEEPDVADRLRKALDGRPLASVTLQGLERLGDERPLLDAVGALLAEHRAVAVASVPNVTHVDVAVKSLLGQWTHTDDTHGGLLGTGARHFWSHDALADSLARSGLRKVDSHDVVTARSDQHFPAGHAGLSEATPFSRYLRHVRDEAEGHGLVSTFVWALAAAPVPTEAPGRGVDESTGDVFLSIVMRTQGRRPQELREALLCLAAQSCQDFEVLLIAHKTSAEELAGVEAVVADQPPYLREKIRLLPLDHGRRSTPLNLGLDSAYGRYLAVFDDDDVVMGDWVKEFADLERDSRGRVLRTMALRQAASVDDVRGLPGIRSTSAPDPMYSPTFSLADHLVENESPPISWVFPRSLVTHFGIRYDESMTTTEDWELLLRAAEIAGVRDTGRGTAIYRWWETRESSRTEHHSDEWRQNQHEIERRVDARPFLLPPGETRQLREDLRELRRLRKLTNQQARKITRLEKRQTKHFTQIKRLRRKLGQDERGRPLPVKPGAPAPPTAWRRLRRRVRGYAAGLRRRLGS